MSDVSLKKLPPHCLDAERQVIGAVLLDSKSYFTAVGIITHQDFYRGEHRAIWKALEQLHANNQDSMDTVILANYLDKQDKLDDVGGRGYLAELLGGVPTAGHIKHHALIVKDKATLRGMVELGHSLYQDAYEGGKDAGELIEIAERRFYELALYGKGYDAAKDVLSPEDMAKRAFDRVVKAKEKPQHVKGIAVGFNNFDYCTKGLPDLTILAASTGMGKTGLALNWASKIGVEDKIPCLYLNYEMAENELINRLLAMLSGVEIDQIKSGHYTPQDNYDLVANAVDDLHGSKLFITDNEPKDINTTISLIYQHTIQHGIKVVFIDYLGEITPDDLALRERSEYITYGRWVQMLKGISAKLGIRLVVLAQLNRAGETDPSRDNIGGSYKLIQKADLLCIVYVNKNGEHLLKIAKQRHGIYPITLEFSYNKLTQRIKELGSWKEKAKQ